MLTQIDILKVLEYHAKKPAGPGGRVTLGLWWQQKGREAAEKLFSGSQLKEVKSIAVGLINENTGN